MSYRCKTLEVELQICLLYLKLLSDANKKHKTGMEQTLPKSRLVLITFVF